MAVIVTITAGPDIGLAALLPPGHHTLGRLGSVRLSDAYLPRIALRMQVGDQRICLREIAAMSWPSRLRLAWRGRGGEVGLRRPLSLVIANTTVTFSTPKPAAMKTARATGELVRLVIAAVMLAIAVPLALLGPPWRWLMVAMPLMMLASSVHTAAKHRREPDSAGALLAAHLLGARASPKLRLPPVICKSVTLQPAAAWSLLGANAIAEARWLAGWLALSHDPAVLQVSSPWLSSREPATPSEHSPPLHVIFAPAALAKAPGENEMVITFGGPLPWAGALRARGFRRLPGASAAFSQAVNQLLTTTARTELPTRVDIGELVSLRPADVVSRWQQPASWAVPIGKDHAGPRSIDLVADGPHALVAGTTGAGKSEFLTTWLLGLAGQLSPRQLQFVLVDFKGGAAFGPLTALPHSVDLLTDLQPRKTARALASLGAQLRRREALFAASGVRDISEYHRAYPGRFLARIVVVIDEFAALAADHPAVLSQLVRLAGQGRSLGLHLIAATQRPAGVVDATMRANMALRICFRVTTAADSTDILGEATAAKLPAIAGRCVIAATTTQVVQAAWCGPVGAVSELVAHIRAAWRQVGSGEAPTRPWAEELPTRIAPRAKAWGLADHPETLDHRDYFLPRGPVAVIGGVASGKTVAAARAAELLATSGEVVVIGKQPLIATATGWIDARDAHLSRLFLSELQPDTNLAVVIDDAHLWRASCDEAFGPSWFGESMEALLRSARQVVVTADASVASARWMHNVPTRLVLSGIDLTAQAMLGVAKDAQQTRAPVGRAYDCASDLQVQFAHVPIATALRQDARWHSLPRTAQLPAGEFALSLPNAAPFTPPVQSVIVCAPPGDSGHLVATRLQLAWRTGGSQVPIIPADQLEGGDGPNIVVTTAGELASAITGPLAALRQRAATLLVQPQRLSRTLAAGAHIESWVFAPCPAHRLAGDAIWIGEQVRVLRVPITAP